MSLLIVQQINGKGACSVEVLQDSQKSITKSITALQVCTGSGGTMNISGMIQYDMIDYTFIYIYILRICSIDKRLKESCHESCIRNWLEEMLFRQDWCGSFLLQLVPIPILHSIMLSLGKVLCFKTRDQVVC